MNSMNPLLTVAALAAMGLAACSQRSDPTVWPVARPIARSVATYSDQTRIEKPPAVDGALTVQRAIELSLERNPELAAAYWRTQVAAGHARQAGLIPNPALGVEIENFGGSGDLSGFDGAETTIALSQTILVGGDPKHRRRIANIEQRAAALRYEATRIGVVADTYASFADALAGELRLRIVEQADSIATHVRESVAAQVAAGAVSSLQLARADAEAASARAGVVRARSELSIARRRLAGRWDGTLVDGSGVAGTLDAMLATPALDAVLNAVEQSPEWSMVTLEVERSRSMADLAAASAIPDPSIGAGYRRLDTGSGAFVATLELDLPVYDRNQGARQAAAADIRRTEQLRRGAVALMRLDAQSAWSDLEAAHEEAVTLRTSALPSGKDAHRRMAAAYDQGRVAVFDLLDTRRQLTAMQAQYVDALVRWHHARARLERVTGVPLADLATQRDEESR